MCSRIMIRPFLFFFLPFFLCPPPWESKTCTVMETPLPQWHHYRQMSFRHLSMLKLFPKKFDTVRACRRLIISRIKNQESRSKTWRIKIKTCRTCETCILHVYIYLIIISWWALYVQVKAEVRHKVWGMWYEVCWLLIESRKIFITIRIHYKKPRLHVT